MLSISCKIFKTTTGVGNSGDNLLPETSLSLSSVIGSNNDLLIQILLCLPVKSLLVFKSVSKRWLSLISDPYFVHNHFLRNPRQSISGLILTIYSLGLHQNLQFIFLDGRKVSSGVPLKTLTFPNDPTGIVIEQSCNGLLCCSSVTSYYIYNPSTKHYKILPESQFRGNGFVPNCSVSLAFDPLKSPHYEVICIWKNEKKNYKIEIYSSKTNSWRLSGYDFYVPIDLVNKSGVFWNGSLHWASSWTDSSIYLDIDRELVKTMPEAPRPDKDEWGTWRTEYFGECRGHLYLIEIFEPCTTFDVLEMEIDYSGWNIKYRVHLEALTIAYLEMGRGDNIAVENVAVNRFFFSVLHIVEEEESPKLVIQIPNKVISYNLKEMSFKKIHDLSNLDIRGFGSNPWINAYQYMESLASV